MKSVFDSLGAVQGVIESGRVDGDVVHVNIDTSSVGVYLSDSELYFEGYTDAAYLMAPGGEYECQCLYYGGISRVEDFVVELVGEFLCGVDVEYRGRDCSTDVL